MNKQAKMVNVEAGREITWNDGGKGKIELKLNFPIPTTLTEEEEKEFGEGIQKIYKKILSNLTLYFACAHFSPGDEVARSLVMLDFHIQEAATEMRQPFVT